jgi:dinuclear metal center YbgI/SA1388 family protein
MKFKALLGHLNEMFPLKLAEKWDNVGFIFGDSDQEINKVLVCLTVTPEVVEEAQKNQIDLIISHHPFPFKKVNRITTDTVEGKMILSLAKASINVYSPHTAFDSADGGINESTLTALGITSIEDLVPKLDMNGAGRVGRYTEPVKLSDLVNNCKNHYGLKTIKVVAVPDAKIEKVAVACGSGGDFFAAAKAKGVDAFITGEASFHTCVAARSHGISLILTGHYASERIAVEDLAAELSSKFKKISVAASEADVSPVVMM